jgi:hypothetical protein
MATNKSKENLKRRVGKALVLVLSGSFLLEFGLLFWFLHSQAKTVGEYVLLIVLSVFVTKETYVYFAGFLFWLATPVLMSVDFLRALRTEKEDGQGQQQRGGEGSASEPSTRS